MYTQQLDDTAWKSHDAAMQRTALADIFLERLAAAGYFTPATLKDEKPISALVGLACFHPAAEGDVMVKTAHGGSCNCEIAYLLKCSLKLDHIVL